MGSFDRGSPRLSAALFGKTRRAVLSLLLARPDEMFYLRQIVRTVRCGQGGVQRELQRLAGAGIITRAVRERTPFYQANRTCPVFAELRALVLKTVGAAGLQPATVSAGRLEPVARRKPGAPAPAARRVREPRSHPIGGTWPENMPSELL